MTSYSSIWAVEYLQTSASLSLDGESDNEEEGSDGEIDSMGATVFSRLEETRHQLERELGFDRFMKAYRFIQVGMLCLYFQFHQQMAAVRLS